MSVRPLSASLRSAATLIELLLFITIFSVVTFTVVPLLFSATQNRVLQQNKALVEENSAQVLQSIQYRAQGANNILLPAKGQTGPILVLQTGCGATNPTVVGASGGYVYIVVKTKKIRVTSPEVYVDNFVVRNTSPTAEQDLPGLNLGIPVAHAAYGQKSFSVKFRTTRIAGNREQTPYAKTYEEAVTIPVAAQPPNDACAAYDRIPVCINHNSLVLKVADGSSCYDATVQLVCDQVPVCGDRIISGAEQCDDGDPTVNPALTPPYNSNLPGANCRTDCKLARCGDSIQDPGAPRNEQCDLGPSNSDTGTCTTSCKTAVCGDGFTQASNNEQCDLGAGNNVDTGACTSLCRNATCGDGKIWTGHEQCDPPNGTTCDNSCQIINPPTNNPYCTCDTKACFGSNQYKISYKCFTDNTMATPATFAGGQTATIGGQTAQITGNIVSKTFNVPPTISGDYGLSLPGLTLTMGTTCNVSPAVNSCSACLVECGLCPANGTPTKFKLTFGGFNCYAPSDAVSPDFGDGLLQCVVPQGGKLPCSALDSTTEANQEWVLTYQGNCRWATEPTLSSSDCRADWRHCSAWGIETTGTIDNAQWVLASGWATSTGNFQYGGGLLMNPPFRRDNRNGCFNFDVQQTNVGPPYKYCRLNNSDNDQNFTATIHVDNVSALQDRRFMIDCTSTPNTCSNWQCEDWGVVGKTLTCTSCNPANGCNWPAGYRYQCSDVPDSMRDYAPFKSCCNF